MKKLLQILICFGLIFIIAACDNINLNPAEGITPPASPTDDGYEENDDAESASELPVISLGSNDSYDSLEAMDDDWYKITVNTTVTLDISLIFTHSLGDIDVWLYDQTTLINDDYSLGISDSSTDNENISHEVEPGSYWLLVENLSAGSNTYNLNIQGAVP